MALERIDPERLEEIFKQLGERVGGNSRIHITPDKAFIVKIDMPTGRSEIEELPVPTNGEVKSSNP